MANHTFFGKVTHEAGTASTDSVIKSQLDSGVADAKARSNHTGTQLAATISDFTAAADARIALVIAGAPGALDTLNELAAALGNDPNFAATTATALGALDTRVDALEAGAAMQVFKATIGDGVATNYDVTHSLTSTDVVVSVHRLVDGQTVFPVVKRTSSSVVNVDFGVTVPATNTYRVIVTAV